MNTWSAERVRNGVDEDADDKMVNRAQEGLILNLTEHTADGQKSQGTERHEEDQQDREIEGVFGPERRPLPPP